MPAPRRNTFQKDAPKSLRRNNNSPTFTDEQLLVVSVFTTALNVGGHGVYTKLNAEGNSLRVKIYTDDDSYTDTITNQDDLVYLLADYAQQLKVKEIFDGLLAALNATTRPAPPRDAAKTKG